jgi:hypothetical protein
MEFLLDLWDCCIPEAYYIIIIAIISWTAYYIRKK